MYKCFTSVLYSFFYFNATVSRILFLISFWESLLLLYRNTTDSCILILYPIKVLNSIFGLVWFCEILWVYHMGDHATCNKYNFTSSFFFFRMLFISFSYLTALTSTSSIMVTICCKLGILAFLIPNLGGKVLTFSSLRMMLDLVFSCMILLSCWSNIPLLLVCYKIFNTK